MSECTDYKTKLDLLRRDLKNKIHETKIQDFEINDLKRKLRSVSTKRFAMSPDFVADMAEYSEVPKAKDFENYHKLNSVKSDSRIPSATQRPPRSDTSSPAAQKIRQLRTEIEKVNKQVDMIKKPVRSYQLEQ